MAQNPLQIVDSLKIELRKNPDQKKTAQIYADLAWYFNMISMDSAIVYGKKSIELSKQLNDDKMLSQALSDFGAILYTKGDYDEALKYLNQSLAVRQKNKDVEGIASINYKLANVYYKKFELQRAMNFYLKSLNYYEQTDNKAVVAAIEGNIAVIYTSLKNYPKAMDFLLKSEKFFLNSGQDFEVANTKLSIGNLYLMQKDTAQAITAYKDVVDISLKVNNLNAVGSAYNNLGVIYSAQKNFKVSIQYFKKSLVLRQNANQTADVASSQLSIAGDYVALGQFQKAKPLLLQSLKVFIKDSIRQKMSNVYLQLIPVYAALGKVDSVSFYTNKYLEHINKNLDQNAIKITNELETKYQSEKKERLLAETRATVAEKSLEIRNKTQLLLGLGILILFVGLLGFMLVNQQRLKNLQLKRESVLNEALAVIETQNKLQNQRLEISRDLHDNIGSQLTFIISSLDNLKFSDAGKDRLHSRINSISDFTSATINELRDTIWAMNEDEISLAAIINKVHDLLDKARISLPATNFSVDINSDANMKIHFSSIDGMNIYRVIQEAVNNAIKYSDAKNISITVREAEKLLRIDIYDDGVGFDLESAKLSNGIHNMKKRAKEIGAHLMIESKANWGTKVKLELPQPQ